MATYYAWSPIRGAVHSNGDTINVRVGDEVSADDLDMDDEDFQYLIDTGAVRTTKYPVAHDSPLSPVEHFKQQAAQMMEGGYQGTQDEEQIAENLETGPRNRFA